MKTMTSIIKEDGSPVQVTIQEGNNRKNYQVSLNDYIASISFDTDEVQCFYPPVGKIPKECIDFSYARNCSKFSCRALFKLPADRQLIVYCGQAFLVALPALVFDFTVIDEVLIPKRSFVYSEKNGVLYHYPLTNVYEDGRICWGNLKIPACMSVSDMKRAVDFFMQAPGNSDLSMSTNILSLLEFGSMGEFIKYLTKVKHYPNKGLIPVGKNLSELLKSWNYSDGG